MIDQYQLGFDDMEYSIDGDYVLYSDHEQAIAALQAKLDVAVRALNVIAFTAAQHRHSVEQLISTPPQNALAVSLGCFANEAIQQISGDVLTMK